MKTKQIQELICKREVLKHNIPCENISNLLLQFEMDVLSINKNGYLTEFEVKTSRSDFKADFKKKKWQFYRQIIETLIPNYFYYVCPDNMINVSEIPDYFGLIYIINNELCIIKKAKIMHRYKHNKIKVLTKFNRVMSERIYLGKCRLTYNNEKLKKKQITSF